MQEKEAIAFFSMILGVIFFFALPLNQVWYSVTLICFGFSLALIKKMWGVAGWAADKIESNTYPTYILSEDENKRKKEKSELKKIVLILIVVLILFGLVYSI